MDENTNSAESSEDTFTLPELNPLFGPMGLGDTVGNVANVLAWMGTVVPIDGVALNESEQEGQLFLLRALAGTLDAAVTLRKWDALLEFPVPVGEEPGGEEEPGKSDEADPEFEFLMSTHEGSENWTREQAAARVRQALAESRASKAAKEAEEARQAAEAVSAALGPEALATVRQLGQKMSTIAPETAAEEQS